MIKLFNMTKSSINTLEKLFQFQRKIFNDVYKKPKAINLRGKSILSMMQMRTMKFGIDVEDE